MAVAAPYAHVTGYPHQDYTQQQAQNSSDGASPVLIIVGIAVTVALVAALIWLRERMRAAAADEDGTAAGDGAEPTPS